MKRRLFTLIELIVIVATMGILASLLVSVMQKGMSVVKAKSCAEKMRNQAVWINEYAGDNTMSIPHGSLINSNFITWDDKLSDYDGRNMDDSLKNTSDINNKSYLSDEEFFELSEPYQCPNDDKISTKDGQIVKVARSYALNKGVWKSNWRLAGVSPDPTLFTNNEPQWAYKQQWLLDPANNIVSTEVRQSDIDDRDIKIGSQRQSVISWKTVKENALDGKIANFHYDLKMNYLMGDMHLEFMTFEETYADASGEQDLISGPDTDVYGTNWDAGLRWKNGGGTYGGRTFNFSN